jgi:hypothetical protein
MDVTDGTITTRLSQASGAALIGTSTNHSFFFMTNDTERMRLDTSGNLGLGVTPSAWGYSGNLQIKGGSAVSFASQYGAVYANAYDNSGFKYIATAPANAIGFNNGQIEFKIAPSGTAGNAITFTQAMTLDAGGNLLVGATSAAGNSKGYFFANADTSHTVRITNASSGSSAYANLVVSNNAGNVVELGMQSSTRSTTYPANEAWMYTSNGINIGYAGDIKFYTGGTERARINSSGSLLIGTTSNPIATTSDVLLNVTGVSASGWSPRIVCRNSNMGGAAFLGTYTGGKAGVFAHSAALDAWAPLYVNTVDGTAANCGDVIMGNRLLVSRTTLPSFISSWGVVAIGNAAALVGPPDTNAILCANAYYDGSWRRINAGTASIIEMNYGGAIATFTSGSSTAGSVATWTAGPYVANGSNTWTNGSDARLKNITGEIQNGLAKVMTLRAAEFTWKHDSENKPCVGLIAQDVQAVLPEAIDESSYIRDDETKYLGVNYDQTIPLLVAAIKEQQAIIQQLQADVAALKGTA